MNHSAFLRNLIIYAICWPAAIIVGYWAVSAANVPTYSSLSLIGIVALVLSTPILLRWHYPLMIFCWSLPVTLFFLQGSPTIGLAMIAISLGISLLQRATNRNMHFIRAPQIVLPLCALIVVVLVTAKFTGGIGLHSLGSEVMGGKKYVFLLAGIFGYFALTARRIPPEHANRYIALFFLPPCIGIIGELVNVLPSFLYWIFLVIPPDFYGTNSAGATRFPSIGGAAMTIFLFMLVRYGIRGIFLEGKWWRPTVLILSFVGIFFGGFRSFVGLYALIFLIQFFMEGMHRTKLLPLLIFMGVFAAVLCVPFSNHLPRTFQRALSFLPLNIDPMVRAEAEGSLDWRIEMWKAVLPQVPQHLLLGKGYAITQEDWEFMGRDEAFHAIDPAEQSLALSGDYHNGPLSVILPFGIWGTIAWLWFLIAGGWALHHNHRYGNPALQTINLALFALFIAKVIFFFFIFGSLYSDLAVFVGIVGMSVSINGGMMKPAPKPRSAVIKFKQPRALAEAHAVH